MKVEVSYLEIYNERVRCLLNPSPGTAGSGSRWDGTFFFCRRDVDCFENVMRVDWMKSWSKGAFAH